MGDVGYRDNQGRIWFCARKAHRVVTATPGGETLFTIPCEAVFNTHPAVFRTALVGVGSPGAMRPVLCVERQRRRPAAGSTQELPALEGRTQTRAPRAWGEISSHQNHFNDLVP